MNKFIFWTFLLVGCVLTSCLISKDDKQDVMPVTQVQQSESRTKKAVQAQTIRVQVTGAVLEPGIYELPAGSRAEAVIAAAGGFTEDADTERVNLVRKLRDGTLVRVPAVKQAKNSAVKSASSRKSIKAEGQPTVKRAQKRKDKDGKN